jgi:ribosome-binding factor A
MLNYRLQKLNQLIREEVGKIIQEEFEFKMGVLVTIIGVETSKDISHAKISLSVLPEGEEINVLRTLEKNIFHIQKLLNKKLVMRYVPKIRFVIDRSLKKAARIEEIGQKL